MTALVRIVRVDDHTLFRKGLAILIEGRNGIQVIAVGHGVTSRTATTQKPE